MMISIAATVMAENMRSGHRDGITVYSICLLNALKNVFKDINIQQVSALNTQCGIGRFKKGYEIATATRIISGLKLSPSFFYGASSNILHTLDFYIPSLTIPVVATVHDVTPLSMPDVYSPKLRKIKNFVFKQKIHFADRLITDSYYSANEISEYTGYSRDRIDVAYLGVSKHILDQAACSPDFEKISQDFSLLPNYILFCGSVAKKKNILRLIEAYRSLPNAIRREHQLVIVGDQYSGGEGGEAVSSIHALEANGEARWLGRLSDADHARVMQNAIAFVFPSLHEGFGLPVLEAFALGVPVITSNSTALKEISGDAALLVDPLSVESIRDGILRVLTDESIRQEFSRRGRERAKQFSWDRCAKETFDVYKKLL